MKPEEYYISNRRSLLNVIEKSNRKIQQFDFYDMCSFAEDYAKSIIESISQDEIEKYFEFNTPIVKRSKIYGVKWIISKQLKKIDEN